MTGRNKGNGKVKGMVEEGHQLVGHDEFMTNHRERIVLVIKGEECIVRLETNEMM